MKHEWLDSAVFYEVYPTSFFDYNGDGIGDIQGIIHKLDYIEKLGCNGIWLNPCFCSPFRDGGYDVSDYYNVDPRFGTNDDLKELFDEGKKRGIRILLDLVMGHTSDAHPWFKLSCEEDKNEFTDAYIWSKNLDPEHCEPQFLSGLSQRPQMYKVNFYASQPALNFGYYRPEKPWQMAMDSPAAKENQKRLIDVCEFWLEMGAAGFRVDMAHCMVKNDKHYRGNILFWKEIFKVIKTHYPESVFLPEWNRPLKTIPKAGFDIDFYYPYGYAKTNTSPREQENENIFLGSYISDNSKLFFNFLAPFVFTLPKIRRTKGYHILFQDDHDTVRLTRGRSDDMVRVLWASYITLPGVPLIYYGNEIGMRYRPMKSKDGGYHRTPSRTPMQWDNIENLGFSESKGPLYLPVEDVTSPYTVAAQMADEHSIYHTVETLVKLKRSLSCLKSTAPFKVLHTGKFFNGNPFIYKRSSERDEMIVVILPRKEQIKISMKKYLKGKIYQNILQNASFDGTFLTCQGTSFAVFWRNIL